jgi:hypothetical protein
MATLSGPIVPLLKLTHFHYSGFNSILNDFMSRLSAPSLQDARFEVCIKSPLLYLSRVIDDVSGEFRSVSVTFDLDQFHLSMALIVDLLGEHQPLQAVLYVQRELCPEFN